ncbi:hypothetical protein G7046_g4187 [Stylonectria norvegica]|nr:hypothetical protein G7046_g4187 [Stylonectria norvegica]
MNMNMAPAAQAQNSGIIYQSSINSNCLVFLGPDVELDVVTRLDSAGKWHASVLRIEANRRSAVLTETADSLPRALELLHEKSARAVDQYTTTNGYDLPPRDATITGSSGRDRGRRGGVNRRTTSPSEVIAMDGWGSSEASGSDGELEGFSLRGAHASAHAHGRRGRRAVRGGGPKARARRVPTDGYEVYDESHDGTSSDESDAPVSYFPRQRRCSPVRYTQPPPQTRLPQTQLPSPFPIPAPAQAPAPGVSASDMGIPPPPGWHPSIQPHSRPSYPKGPGAQDSHLPNMPPSLVTGIPRPPAHLQPLPMKLNITWIGHGTKKMLVRCQPTEHAIQHRAIEEVRLRTADFANVTPADLFLAPRGGCRLFASIKSIRLGEYELSGFKNDFSQLCSGSRDIPAFDIEIKSGTPVFVPQMQSKIARSVNSEESDRDIIDV